MATSTTAPPCQVCEQHLADVKFDTDTHSDYSTADPELVALAWSMAFDKLGLILQ